MHVYIVPLVHTEIWKFKFYFFFFFFLWCVQFLFSCRVRWRSTIVSTMVISRVMWLMTIEELPQSHVVSLVNLKFLNCNLELFIFIYMDIGGPSGRGRSRKWTRGQELDKVLLWRTFQEVMIVVSSGSGIGPMPTQTSNTRLSYLAGSWKQENNVPYHEIPGPTPGIVNASSTILKHFFFHSWVWELLVQEISAYHRYTQCLVRLYICWENEGLYWNINYDGCIIMEC